MVLTSFVKSLPALGGSISPVDIAVLVFNEIRVVDGLLDAGRGRRYGYLTYL